MGNVTFRSPFIPEQLARLEPIEGVRFATAEAGIRYQGRTDLMVSVLDEGTTVAGVLTQSKTASAPVLACRKHLLQSFPYFLCQSVCVAHRTAIGPYHAACARC